MIKTYMALETATIKKDNTSVPIRLISGVEFEYDSVAIENDIPSDLYSETDTWKKLVIPATASGVAFAVEKEIELNPIFDTKNGKVSFVERIYCKSKAPVAITNFKIEIEVYNDLNSTPLVSTWVQQINALATSKVLNGTSNYTQIINLSELKFATRIKIKISGTPDANIEEDTDFIIYPDGFVNLEYKQEFDISQQPSWFSGAWEEYQNLRRGTKVKEIENAPVKNVDFDIKLDYINTKSATEYSGYAQVFKVALVRAGTTASIVALSGAEKFQLKTEGYGASGVLINKNVDGSVIEAICSYAGELTFTLQLATAGWYNLVTLDDDGRFTRSLCSFYVNNA